MATYNTSYPFEPISVGPVINLGKRPLHRSSRAELTGADGFDDFHFINYAAAITPLPPSYLDPSLTMTMAESAEAYLPDHFFLDDLVVMSLGVRDWEMANIVLGFDQLLGRHKMCE